MTTSRTITKENEAETSFGMPRIVDPDVDLILHPSPKRIRIAFAGTFIADTRDARILFERGHLPVYYLPLADVREEVLLDSDKSYECPRKGQARYWSLQMDGRVSEDAAWNYPEPIAGCPPISDLVAFEWDAVDAWYEEDEELTVHPRNPYTRIEVLESSRRVEVRLGGTTIAESDRPALLFETGLPIRYYLPKPDILLNHLHPSPTITHCPYKGTANRYWTVEAARRRVEDAAWSYDHPRLEASGIAGRIAFFSERVDVLVDGDPLDHDVRL